MLYAVYVHVRATLKDAVEISLEQYGSVWPLYVDAEQKNGNRLNHYRCAIMPQRDAETSDDVVATTAARQSTTNFSKRKKPVLCGLYCIMIIM